MFKVCCNDCGKPVKASQFAAHAGSCFYQLLPFNLVSMSYFLQLILNWEFPFCHCQQWFFDAS